MRAPRALSVAVVVLVLLLGAACGGDDSGGGGLSEDEQAYAEALAVDLQDADDGYGVSEADATCMSESVMQVLGVDPFVDNDIEPEDLDGDDSPGELLGDGTVSDEDAAAIAEAWDGCTDLPRSFAEAGRGEFGLDDDGVACLEEGLQGNDILAGVVAASFTSATGEPDADTLQQLVTLVSECSTDEAGEGGLLVDSIAQSLIDGAQLSEADARCVAQDAVDSVGADRLVEMTADGGDFEDAPMDVQDELAAAILAAAQECDVPIDRLGN